MSDGLQNFLTNLVTHGSISGLLAVTIIDRQGAPIFQVMAPQLSESERNKSHNFLASNRFTSLGAQDATVANERLGEVKYLRKKFSNFRTRKLTENFRVKIASQLLFVQNTRQFKSYVTRFQSFFLQIQMLTQVHH